MTAKNREELREKIAEQFGKYAISFEVDGRYSEKPYVSEVLSLIYDLFGGEANFWEAVKKQKSPRQIDAEKNNPCFGCEYRKPNEKWYVNICLLDESKECPR